MNIFRCFLTGEEKSRITDQSLVKRMFKRARIQGVTAMIVGYGMYYVMRLTLGVVKHPMLNEGFTPMQLGSIGAAMTIAIAFGKCLNGFLADSCNIKKIVPLGLLGAAVVNFILGFSHNYWVFLALWFINGCFQSMGSAPCIVSLSQWFSKSKLATYYGVFSIAHYIGEAATYIGSAMLVAAFGWHSAFYIPGVVCIFLAVIMYKCMYDRPQAYGLPSANEFEGEMDVAKKEKGKSTKEAQLEAIKNPYVWIVAISAICLGIARYSIDSWGVVFLQEQKGFSLVAAGGIISICPIMGGVGSFLSGIISDKIFKSRHSITTIVFGIMMLVGIAGFCYAPASSPTLNMIFMAIYGFGLGVNLCFIGGMLAVDFCSQKATGAAMGIVGLLAYFGATAQEFVNAKLMSISKLVVNGKVTYNFHNIELFWIISVIIMTVVIIPTLWGKKVNREEEESVGA
ncbi:MFS transporter [Clostridium sp. JS66]|uniref:MFS transporter n=1 Tax=Clostridium sp. JS66 TaxID=3064705 RepID=UPI00298E1E14|nr:MFS transporter [Clostridium sp. JS66]WPC42551.1 MFS transporter [Clostridium sp. JS66]